MKLPQYSVWIQITVKRKSQTEKFPYYDKGSSPVFPVLIIKDFQTVS